MNSNQNTDKLYEIDLLTFFYILAKRRKIIIYFVSAILLISAVVLFLFVDRYYEANATVMPSKQRDQFSASSFLKNALPLGGLGIGKTSDELLTFTTILTSRSSYERIVSRFDLMKVYDQETIDEAIKELKDNVEFVINNDDNALEITAFDTDSTRAKEIAAYCVEILNDIYIKLNSTEARNNREFIQKRYEQTLYDLQRAEDTLRKFQEKFGVFTTTEQIKASITAAAELKSQIVLKEVQRGVLQRTLSTDNPEIRNVELQIDELQKQLRLINLGENTESASNVYIPLARIPRRALDYIRLMREVEIQTKIQETLLPLYEQAKIEENRDTPTVVVLDSAHVSDKPVKPRRLIILSIIAILSIVLSIFVVFIVESFERLKNDPKNKNDKVEYLTAILHPKQFFRFDK